MSEVRPPWIRAVTKPGAMVFAILFSLESLARATLWTIVPLQAFELLGNARDVTLLNLTVSLSSLIGGLTIPLLIGRFRRRWIYSCGVCLVMLAGLLLATGTRDGQIGGMFARALGGAVVKLESRHKPAYHAAGAFVAGHTLALMETATRILLSMGFNRRQASRGLLPLIRQMLDNFERFGPSVAWTGPLSRGDYETVAGIGSAMDPDFDIP